MRWGRRSDRQRAEAAVRDALRDAKENSASAARQIDRAIDRYRLLTELAAAEEALKT